MSGLPDASEPYTDTFIIDCNRNSSIEADTGTNENPAIFTNKQGTGLRLNRGDKVSIHSAFINEIGNTDGTIEFKGQSVKDTHQREITYELEETTDDLQYPMPLDDLYSSKSNFPWTLGAAEATLAVQYNNAQILGDDKEQILQPYGHQLCDSSNVKKTFVLKDNEMNVEVCYYKTANGENYIHLPRRFDMYNGAKWEENGKAGADKKTTAVLSTRMDPNEGSMNWGYQGMQWSGAPMTTLTNAAGQKLAGHYDGGWNGQPVRDIRIQSQVADDWFYQDRAVQRASSGGILEAGKDHAGKGITFTNATDKSQGPLNVLGTNARYRWKNDNARYTIFKKERTFFTTAPQFSEFLDNGSEYAGQVIKPSRIIGNKTNDFLGYTSAVGGADGHPQHGGNAGDDTDNNYYWNVRDPACTGNWIKYKEIKNVKVEPGFKSPNDIADEVSRGFNKTGEVKEIFARTGIRGEAANTQPSLTKLGASHQRVGLQKDGELFKGFYSTNHAHFNSGNCEHYFKKDAGKNGSYPEDFRENIRYMSAYHYIGVKRPELWETGRKFVETAASVGTGLGNTWGEITEFSINSDRPAIAFAGRATAQICTNIKWSNRHLFKDFVVAQGRYPELFDYSHSNIKKTGSSYKDNTDVDDRKFQMGNSKTGERLAGYIHYDIIPHDDGIYREDGNVNGKKKSGYRRLGNDGYDLQFNTDYNDRGGGAEESPSGYTMKVGPPIQIQISATGQASSRVGHLPYYDLSSTPLWFWYDQSRAELDEGGNDLAEDDFNLCYGFMKKYNPKQEGDSADNTDYIAFTTTRIGGIPDYFFQTGGNPQTTEMNNKIDSGHYIGYDRHFNAYGTKSMMLYSGQLAGIQPDINGIVPPKEGMENTDFEFACPPGNANAITSITATTGNLEQTYGYNLHQYIGANAPLLSFGGDSATDSDKRFNFQQLHTPEYIGNNYNAGADGGDPVSADEANGVYKINKRLSGANFCPEMIPYQTDVATTTKSAAGVANNALLTISTSNYNLTQWIAIFDASSGIMFNSFGGEETIRKYWHKTLWGLLGFSYDQFNYVYTDDKDTNYKNRLNVNSRLNPDNQGQTPELFTNASVKTSDISLYSVNMYGADLFTQGGISFGGYWNAGADLNGKMPKIVETLAINNPAISVDAISVALKANRQPTKMLRPYYLIASNIVGDMKYIGAGHSTDGGQQLPIIGVVNKENGFGDYYFQTDQKAVFTITSDTTLSEIKTSIHDPDMSSARVDKNSAVLYMVQKTNNNNLNIIPGLLQTNQIPPALIEPPLMNDAEYNQYFKSMILTPQEQVLANQGYVQAHYDQGGELVNPVADAERQRSLESFLGLREGESPARLQERDSISEGVHNTPQGTLTRKQSRQLDAFRGMQERAKAGLYQRMVPAGRSRPEQSGEMPGWYDQATQGNEGSTLQTQQSESSVMTGPSEPGLAKTASVTSTAEYQGSEGGDEKPAKM